VQQRDITTSILNNKVLISLHQAILPLLNKINPAMNGIFWINQQHLFIMDYIHCIYSLLSMNVYCWITIYFTSIVPEPTQSISFSWSFKCLCWLMLIVTIAHPLETRNTILNPILMALNSRFYCTSTKVISELMHSFSFIRSVLISIFK
jgi:hypothetical protein